MPTTPYMGWLGIVLDRYEPDDGTYFHGGVIAASQ